MLHPADDAVSPITRHPTVLMLSAEYLFHRVGGMGAHVQSLFPRLANLTRVDLFVPQYDGRGAAEETVGRCGRVFRVTANRPTHGHDFDVQVWRMNDQLAAVIAGRIDSGAHYDLIHTHDWLTGYVANDLQARYKLPMVVTFHAMEHGRTNGQIHDALSQRIHLAEWHLARRADLIIACSQYMRDQIIQHLDAPAEKIVVIPNGVEVEQYVGLREQRESLAEFRRQWVAADAPLIFFVGRLVWEKGPDLLVNAMADVAAEFPDARLIIAGTGPLQDELRGMVQYLGLQKHVHLAGFISDEARNKLYAVADVAVFPSRYEPFGIVALEAMACGTPVVVTDVGGLSEVVEHEVTGLRVAPGRVDAVAAGILQTLRHPDAAAERARRAQRVVMRDYRWDGVAEKTLQAYEHALRRAKSNAFEKMQ
ncbi:MAG: glycosyltransferase family 4 protein [Chloroflexi bacterium]|nr:glycosyltransferase family 4 protein [Chloroflexota bacterium]